jgi:predicted phosphodiesterase
VLAVLYDIHGNLPALEVVVGEAEAAGATGWLLGGDYASHSPWPLETLALLRGLPNAVWIRGNGERWLREPPYDRPEVVEALLERESGLGAEEGWLYSLQTRFVLDGILYVHGSPLSDVDSFAPEPQPDDERLLAGVHDQTVVFGHSHVQFRRPGPNGTVLVNPGSVGMPLDGDTRAAWMLVSDGELEFRRTAFDTERVAAAWRALGGGFAEFAARRIELGRD